MERQKRLSSLFVIIIFFLHFVIVVMHATAATDQLESKVNRRLLQHEFGNAVFHPLDPYRPEANPYKPTNSYNRGCNPINHCRSG